MFYTVVLLDGKELHCLSLEEVKDLFLNRQLNQNSLICTAEDPTWQMLKRAFDLSQWISSNAPQAAPPVNSENPFQAQNNPFEPSNPINEPNSYQPQNNPFEQTNPANQPVTFNQFPPDQPNPVNSPYSQNTSNGYSQNNQTETYYQAESSQSQYNFQNNQPNVAPSKYNNAANSYNYAPGYSANHTNTSETRNGLRPAAIFLILNSLFYIAFMIFGSSLPDSGGESGAAYKSGRTTGTFLPIIIDLFLAFKLWKIDYADSTRKWVLARSYFGFIVFGLIIPMVSFKTGQVFLGFFSFVSTFFYFISLTLVLHGKENPSQSRVMVGVGTYAIYFLLMLGTLSFAFIGQFAPNIAKLNLPDNTQFEKYKIEGKEYVDKTNGAKVVLPEGWTMLSLDNPLIHTPEMRMIAIDQQGNRLTMLEVVPVPGNLDLKRQNSAVILDQLADGVVQSLKAEVKNSGGFGGRNSFNEVTRLNIYVGTHPAKLLVFDKTTDGEKAKGHLIITYDELTFYVLHSWCPAEEYDKAQTEFTFFEKNFTIPDKISSPFTQSAEKEKNNANTKKNF